MSLKLLNILVLFISLALSQNGFCEGITVLTERLNPVEDPGISAKVIVDLQKKGPLVSRAFYGSHFDSYAPAPSASLVRELDLGQIRMGGNEYDVFNWKNSYALTKQGLRKIPGFETTAAVLRNYQAAGVFQINMLGYQPEWVSGQYVLKNTFDAKAAGDMIRKLNGDLKLNIEHVSLGNEPEQWHETHSHVTARILGRVNAISADEYIDRYIRFAVAVRQAQEEVTGKAHSIKIWGPEFSASWLDWNTGEMTKDCKWHGTRIGQVVCSYGNGQFDNFQPYFLYRIAKAEKDPVINPRGYKLLDYYSFHYYATLRTKISDVRSVIKDPEGRQWVSKMLEATRVFNDPSYVNTVDISSYRNISPNIFSRVKAWRDRYYPQAKLALNEFALDSDYRSVHYHPIVRPLYLADTLAIAATEGLDYFNNFILSSEAGSNLPWVLLDGTKRTNLFYMYALFSNNFKGTIVQSQDNLGDVVNSYAADSGDSIRVVFVNKSPLDKTVQIYFKNGDLKKITTYSTPGWSASVLKFRKDRSAANESFEIRRYGAEEMGITKDPLHEKFQ